MGLFPDRDGVVRDNGRYRPMNPSMGYQKGRMPCYAMLIWIFLEGEGELCAVINEKLMLCHIKQCGVVSLMIIQVEHTDEHGQPMVGWPQIFNYYINTPPPPTNSKLQPNPEWIMHIFPDRTLTRRNVFDRIVCTGTLTYSNWRKHVNKISFTISLCWFSLL